MRFISWENYQWKQIRDIVLFRILIKLARKSNVKTRKEVGDFNKALKKRKENIPGTAYRYPVPLWQRYLLSHSRK